MNVSSISRMPFSPAGAWRELAHVDSTVRRTFWRIVVPLSLLPPAMIYLAGRLHGGALVGGFGGGAWGPMAALFFLCEIASVTLMAWLVRRVAGAWEVPIDDRDAYVLAAVAAVPLWLSSLGLLVPSAAFNVALAAVALTLSFALLLQGVRSFCTNDVDGLARALDVSRLVFAGGLAAWGFLLLLLYV